MRFAPSPYGRKCVAKYAAGAAELPHGSVIHRSSRTELILEQRRAPRFEVHVPVIFEWREESGASRRESGFVRNISRNGIFAWCEGECPPCHTEIHVALLFPGIGPDAKPWRMRSAGRVLRVHAAPAGKGFAATLEDVGMAVLGNGPPWFRVQ